ncbi:MAG TPA: hypothetical protein VEB42_13605, partial [Chitinophagaceae bacterium]|nr:hypothetical protein [Chitinophagaceae bacterium]
MKKIIIASILLCLHGLLVAQSQGNMTAVPERPSPGDEIKITYNPSRIPLKNSSVVSAIVYAYVNYRWQVLDLPLQKSGKSWQGKLKSSPEWGFFAVKFMAGDSIDNNNDQGYGVMFYDKGRTAPGAYAGWGLLRSPSYGYGIPNYYKNFRISDTATYFWMNQEISFHPNEASVALSIPFAQSLLRYSGKNAMARLNNVIAFLTKKGTEDALWRAHKVQLLAGPKEKADSLQAAIVQQFPNGNLAKLKAYQAMQFEKDAAKKLVLSKEFLQWFPEANASKEFDDANLIKYSTVYNNIVLMSDKESYAVMKQYINELPYASVIFLYYKLIDIMHKRKDMPDAELHPPSVMLFNRIEQFKSVVPNEYWYLSPKEWMQQIEKDMASF